MAHQRIKAAYYIIYAAYISVKYGIWTYYFGLVSQALSMLCLQSPVYPKIIIQRFFKSVSKNS